MEMVEEKLSALSIARRSRPDEPSYLLDLSMQPSHSGSAQGRLIAVSCSDFSIHLHDKDTLKLLGDCKGHSGALCGVTFAHTSPDLLYSASADGTVRMWDVRRPDTEAVRVFKSDPSHHYCSFDLNCSDLVLCAGTEQVNKEDSFLVFWDARVSGKMEASGGSSDGTLLGVYSESHSDDITQVHFHPRDKDRLASGSTDGLVNVFDLSLGGEDEALLATCNSGSSASSVCWSGKDYTQLLCLSHDEGLQLWDLSQLDTEEPLTIYSTVDARSLSLFSGSEESVDYLVGGQWMEEAQRLVVVAGMNSGDLHLLECDGKGLRLLRSLRGGHKTTVRCFLWDTSSAGEVNLVTGGEDGQLLLWKPGGEELMPGKRESMKCDSVLKVKSRHHKKHDYHRDKKTT